MLKTLTLAGTLFVAAGMALAAAVALIPSTDQPPSDDPRQPPAAALAPRVPAPPLDPAPQDPVGKYLVVGHRGYNWIGIYDRRTFERVWDRSLPKHEGGHLGMHHAEVQPGKR